MNAPTSCPYGERTRQVVYLARKGYARKDVARMLGTTPNNVSAILSNARRLNLTNAVFGNQGRGRPNRTGGRRLIELPDRDFHKICITLDKPTTEALFAAAKVRDLALATFVAELLTTVAEDGVIDAVMDDRA